MRRHDATNVRVHGDRGDGGESRKRKGRAGSFVRIVRPRRADPDQLRLLFRVRSPCTETTGGQKQRPSVIADADGVFRRGAAAPTRRLPVPAAALPYHLPARYGGPELSHLPTGSALALRLCSRQRPSCPARRCKRSVHLRSIE